MLPDKKSTPSIIFKIEINRNNAVPDKKIFTTANGNSKGIVSIEKQKDGSFNCNLKDGGLITVKDPSIVVYYQK
jgi:hypothetical protein